MRRLLRDIAEGRVLGDITTLRDPAVMEQLETKVKELQAAEDCSSVERSSRARGRAVGGGPVSNTAAGDIAVRLGCLAGHSIPERGRRAVVQLALPLPNLAREPLAAVGRPFGGRDHRCRVLDLDERLAVVEHEDRLHHDLQQSDLHKMIPIALIASMISLMALVFAFVSSAGTAIVEWRFTGAAP